MTTSNLDLALFLKSTRLSLFLVELWWPVRIVLKVSRS